MKHFRRFAYKMVVAADVNFWFVAEYFHQWRDSLDVFEIFFWNDPFPAAQRLSIHDKQQLCQILNR